MMPGGGVYCDPYLSGPGSTPIAIHRRMKNLKSLKAPCQDPAIKICQGFVSLSCQSLVKIHWMYLKNQKPTDFIGKVYSLKRFVSQHTSNRPSFFLV